MSLRTLAVGLGVVLTLVAGCGSSETSTSTKPETNSIEVSAADLEGPWPLTVESGTLACDGQAVTFSVDGGTYAVNGTARGRANSEGWLPIEDIWAPDPVIDGLKVNIGELVDKGLELC